MSVTIKESKIISDFLDKKFHKYETLDDIPNDVDRLNDLIKDKETELDKAFSSKVTIKTRSDDDIG